MCDLNICRVCLNMNVRGYKIDEYNLRDPYEFIMRKMVMVTESEGLPLWFCYECSSMLNKFVKFRDKCYKGESTLTQMLWSRGISYESIGIINRHNENLLSPVDLIIPSERVKTCVYRHKDNGCITVIEDSEYKIDNPFKNITSLFKQEKISVEIPFDKVPKDDPELPKDDYKAEHDDNMDDTGVDNISVDEDLYTSTEKPIEHAPATLSNNIDIPTEFVPEPSKNIDTDNILKIEILPSDSESSKCEPTKPRNGKEPIKKSNDKTQTKKRRFEITPKKKIINPDHWIKINMGEVEAMLEFKERANSDKFLKANFQCHQCFKGFSKEAMLTRHVKYFHDEAVGSFVCRFCNTRYPRISSLRRHMTEHYVVFQCRRCDMRFKEASVGVHDEFHNGVTRTCKHCGKEFKHLSTYYTHIRMNHRSDHICKLCGASFVSDKGLSQHTLITHFNDKEQFDRSLEQSRNSHCDSSSKPTGEENYCDKCDIKFVTPEAYEGHLLNSKNHAAPTEILKGKYIMKARIPSTCILCGEKFPTRQAYKRHHLQRHKDVPFDRTICEVCGISLVTSTVPQHMVTHKGERPFPCSVCGKRFTQNGAAKRHYNTVHLKMPVPKYPRKTPRKRRKKPDEIPQNDFSPLLRAAFYS